MHVLYVVPNPPSLVRVRPYNLIHGLCDRGHQVTVATPWSSAEERADVDCLRDEGLNVVTAPLTRTQVLRNLMRAVISGLPLQAAYAQVPALNRQIRAKASAAGGDRPVDVVHVEHLRGAHYALNLRGKGTGAPLPVVWDSVDCISTLFARAATHSHGRRNRLMARLELGRTQRYEGWLVRQFARVLAVSPEDVASLEQIGSEPCCPEQRPHATLLPNGVDLDFFSPDATERAPATILFSGKMSYHANETAAIQLVTQIMPRVWARCPEAKVVIAGKDPGRALWALAEQDPRVCVTGTVPDMRPYLRQATVAVAPLVYGAGIQNKVLEAMACATPVVASCPAVAALTARPPDDLLVAETDADFADCIVGLLGNAALRRSVGAKGRQYVETHHRWSSIVGDLADIYAGLAEGKSRQGER